jgi:hypothetical protein
MARPFSGFEHQGLLPCRGRDYRVGLLAMEADLGPLGLEFDVLIRSGNLAGH